MLGINNPERNHDACGVGLATGENAVEYALKMSDCYPHRGAENTVGVGDGAGIVTGLPKIYFAKRAAKLGIDFNPNEFGVGHLFLSQGDDKKNKEIELFRESLASQGLEIAGSEPIGYNPKVVSQATLYILPVMERFFIKNPGMSEAEFEKKLYRARRDFDEKLQDLGLDAYVCSLSNRTVIYKGTLTSDKVRTFFTDFDNVTEYSEGVTVAGVHSRFSTNTNSTPYGAQPFPGLFHNGEINTIGGNIENVSAKLNEVLGIKFPFRKGLSDSGRTAHYFEHLVYEEGMHPFAAMMMMKPFPDYKNLDAKYQDIFETFKYIQQTFDGPANFVFNNGKIFGVSLDRGGLRPSRYTITKDSNILVGSEEAIIDIPNELVAKRGSLRGGEIIGYDVVNDKAYSFEEVLDFILQEGFKGRPFRDWAKELSAKLDEIGVYQKNIVSLPSNDSDLTQQAKEVAYGWHQEAVDKMVIPMARDGKVNVVAMGKDIPEAVFSKLAYHPTWYMSQKFAQVTNPPIDSIRERANMSLETYLGGNPLANKTGKVVKLDSPNLREGQLERILNDKNLTSFVVDATYKIGDKGNFVKSIQKICDDLVDAVKNKGANNIVVSDRLISKDKQCLPDVIIVAAIKDRLKEENISLKTSITVESHQIYSEHHVAMLSQVGADAVDAPLLRQKLKNLQKYAPQLLKDDKHQQVESLEKYNENLYKALDDGLLKIMAKMGINEFEAYKNQKLFETIGLSSKGLIGKIFKGSSSFLEGHTETELQENFDHFHKNALYYNKKEIPSLPNLGLFSVKKEGTGENHLFSQPVIDAFATMLGEEAQARLIREKLPEFEKDFIGKPETEKKKAIDEFLKQIEDPNYAITILRKEIVADNIAARKAKIANIKEAKEVRKTEIPFTPEEIDAHEISPAFRKFEQSINETLSENPVRISHMLKLKSGGKSIPIEQVQPASEIVKHIIEGGISFGANTDLAKKSAAQAFNRVGSKSNTGEGGEPEEVWGTIYNNKKKQVASGRFGLSAEYLANAEEIEIKVAQGAKPGEGGQLPGDKVTVDVAIKRRAIPGTEQISPPPHHDIYSIEDITQLINDIRSAGCKVSIKIVSSDGVDTISSGLAKALLASGLDNFSFKYVDEVGNHLKTDDTKQLKLKAGGINIAGGNGGTGASPITSIYHCGLPNEIGLVQTNQGLEHNKLREIVDINSGGGLITAEDIFKNFILGADNSEMGTSVMILQDCVMARLCGDKCPVGVATNPELYAGDHRNIEQYLINLSHRIRELMAEYGISNLEELKGRTDILEVMLPEHVRGNVDFSGILHSPEKQKLTEEEWKVLKENSIKAKKRPDDFLLENEQVKAVIEGREDKAVIEMDRPLTNQDRSFGIRTSVYLSTRIQSIENAKYPEEYDVNKGSFLKQLLPSRGNKKVVFNDAITVKTHGNAGQSYGAFNTDGLKLEHTGILQDGVGKSATGGEIVVKTPKAEGYKAHENVVIGNACFFGAGAVKGYIEGQAGDRFCVRGSGMDVVVEGVGDFAGEYAGQGCIFNLGKAGKEIGVGSSGLIFMQYDPENNFKVSKDMKVINLAEDEGMKDVIKLKLQEHISRTGSKKALEALDLMEMNPEKASEVFKIAISNELLKDRNLRGINDIKKVLSAMGNINPALTSQVLKMTYSKTEEARGI